MFSAKLHSNQFSLQMGTGPGRYMTRCHVDAIRTLLSQLDGKSFCNDNNSCNRRQPTYEPTNTCINTIEILRDCLVWKTQEPRTNMLTSSRIPTAHYSSAAHFADKRRCPRPQVGLTADKLPLRNVFRVGAIIMAGQLLAIVTSV
jgi:hypothetical protein